MNRINLMLHAHQPYVRHLEYDKFLEEDWLYEALNDSYIPLLRMLLRLEKENIDYHFSMCFSPTLLSMLEDEKPTAVRQCLAALHQVVLYQPHLIEKIEEKLKAMDVSKYKDSMRPLVEKDVGALRKIII